MKPAAELRKIEIFADLPDEDLEWLAGRAEFRDLAPGDPVAEEGKPADFMLALLEGELRGRKERGPSDGLVVAVRAGDVSGMLPFSRMKKFPVTSRAIVPSRVATWPATIFPEMLEQIPALEPRLVAVLSDRVRRFAREEQHREALIALGKLSAGLAHELNNPAAAARRSAGGLRRRLGELCERTVVLGSLRLDAEKLDRLAGIAQGGAGDSPPSDPLARAANEEALAEWLESHGVDEAWSRAETFVLAGLTPDRLEEVVADVPADAVADVLTWIEAARAAESMLDEIESATARISDLVAAIKSYTHMDRAPENVETDLHGGIDSTLTVLGHKLRDKAIEVERLYETNLPRVPAFAGELNQVWTNLIDNAIDALPRGGRIRIRTTDEPACVCVEVTDDGPGIPPEIQRRIWEPFFTTKEVGKGTGLGLDIVHRIVVQRHGGQIRVDSEPGQTRFTVHLPTGAG